MAGKGLYDNEAIIGRVKYLIDKHIGSHSQAEFAKLLDMDPSNLSKHLTGRLPISRALIDRIVSNMGVSKSWLVDGEGVPLPRGEHALVLDDKITPADDCRGVPVYDIDVTAGCMPLDRLFTIDRITGHVDLPRINPESVIVRVSGDSMEPKIIDGGFVAIRPIKSLVNIFWGQIYVIVLEEYRMVKYLRRNPSDDSRVVLHSANPNYDDIDISRADIQQLFLVESILNFRTLC